MDKRIAHIISDTHGRHEKLQLPGGDVLIHCGDFSDFGRKRRVPEFFDWLTSQDYEHFIVVPGNHDHDMESIDYRGTLTANHKNLNILVNRAISIYGTVFYGTPLQRNYKSLAFNRSEAELAIIYSSIPRDTDVLITHAPPRGILDGHNNGLDILGSTALLNTVAGLINLKHHVFGHVHEARGTFNETFINACYSKEMPYWEIEL